MATQTVTMATTHDAMATQTVGKMRGRGRGITENWLAPVGLAAVKIPNVTIVRTVINDRKFLILVKCIRDGPGSATLTTGHEHLVLRCGSTLATPDG